MRVELKKRAIYELTNLRIGKLRDWLVDLQIQFVNS